MIKLEGNSSMFSHKRVERIKKGESFDERDKFRLWVQLNFPMGTLDTNYLRLALTMGETMSHSSTRKFL